MSNVDSFTSKSMLEVNGKNYEIFRLDAVEGSQKLPFSLKVLLENLLRTEDGKNITKDQIEALASWEPSADPSHRNSVHSGTCPYAGLHRCTLYRRLGDHA